MKTMRVIDGNLKPGEAFWNIRNAAETESGETEVEFFGPISEYSWWGDEITPKTFKDALWQAGQGGPVTVKVNSPGGEVFAASAIRSILQDYPGTVTADIIGIAASAATVVVTGADRVKMRDTAMFMIHDPSTIAWGNIEEFEQIVTVLKSVKETILNAYATKTGKSRKELAKMMQEEAWMTAQMALEHGFVDEIVSGPAAKAPAGSLRAGFLNCLDQVPDGFVAEWARMVAEEEAAPVSEDVSGEAETSEETEPVAEEAVEEAAGAEIPEAEDAEVTRMRNYAKIFGRR